MESFYYKCNRCGKVFHTRRELSDHFCKISEVVTGEDKGASPMTTMRKCSVCGELIPETQYGRHQRSCNGRVDIL